MWPPCRAWLTQLLNNLLIIWYVADKRCIHGIFTFIDKIIISFYITAQERYHLSPHVDSEILVILSIGVELFHHNNNSRIWMCSEVKPVPLWYYHYYLPIFSLFWFQSPLKYQCFRHQLVISVLSNRINKPPAVEWSSWGGWYMDLHLDVSSKPLMLPKRKTHQC